MEHLLFSPSDIPILEDLHFSGYDIISEQVYVDIFHSKYQESLQDMESLKRKNIQENLMKSLRKMSLKSSISRLDEYKHAFGQFFWKRLSRVRHHPQHPLQKLAFDERNKKILVNTEKNDFNFPIARSDAIEYGKDPDIYFIGKYCQMKKCEWLGTQVTIRRIITSESSKEEKDALVPEIQVLGQIRHPFILLLLAATFDERQNLMLLYEYVDYGSLFVFLHKEMKTPTTDFVLSVLDQTAQVLIYLHESGWIHTNLSSHALQLMAYQRVKLSCFELAINVNAKNEINTISSTVRSHLYHWQAPEYWTGSKFDTSTDIFQFGLLAWELSQRQVPWQALSERELKEKYLFQKQVLSFNNCKGCPPLTTIMKQAINLRPKDRKLNLKKALKILSSAKESVSREKDPPLTTENKYNSERCRTRHPSGKGSSNYDENRLKMSNAQGEVMQRSFQKQEIADSSWRKSMQTPQKFSSLQDFKASVDTYTGLQRVTKRYFKTSNVLLPRMADGNSTVSKTSSGCSFSSKWTDEAAYSDFSDDQNIRTLKKINRRDDMINLHSTSTDSSLRKLPYHFSAISSMGIKPASHSLEKQPSGSFSHFKPIGTSMPYRASAIKPASHQSERAFSSIHFRTVTDASKIIRSPKTKTICNSINIHRETHKYLQRNDPCFNKCSTGEIYVSHTTQRHSKAGNNCLELKSSNPLNHDIKSAHRNKDIGTPTKGMNLMCEDVKNNHINLLKKHMGIDTMANFTTDKDPEVMTKICKQLWSMMKEPYLAKEVNDILPYSEGESKIKKGKTLNEDSDSNILFKDAYPQNRTLSQMQNSSISILTTLGLSIMDFYEDDELGPSLWHDEHMQLKICQEFGKSIDSFVNIEAFPAEQSHESIWKSDDEEIETDEDLNHKCKFNSLYYKLSQTQDDHGNEKKCEEKHIIFHLNND